MGMPQIPDGKNRPSFEETLIDLLESVALEQLAISHIMNAEGEKLQEVIKQYADDNLAFYQLECSCQSVNSTLNSLIMKEWLLMSRMNSIIDIKNQLGEYYENRSGFNDLSNYSYDNSNIPPVYPPSNSGNQHPQEHPSGSHRFSNKDFNR